MAVAMQERNRAIAQQKNVEKLLEEVVDEKDDLLADRANLKKELYMVQNTWLIILVGFANFKSSLSSCCNSGTYDLELITIIVSYNCITYDNLAEEGKGGT